MNNSGRFSAGDYEIVVEFDGERYTSNGIFPVTLSGYPPSSSGALTSDLQPPPSHKHCTYISSTSTSIDEITDETIKNMIMDNNSASTRTKRQWAYNAFNRWTAQLDNKPDKDITDYSVDQLIFFLPCFILGVLDGKNETYKPQTLFELVMKLQQYINASRVSENKEQFSFFYLTHNFLW